MKRRHKVYLKLNLLSLFCIGVSLISITLAWFAYSGLSTVATEVDVRAWNIEFMKNSEVVTNEIVIDIDDVSPGMDPIIEEVSINNLGDSDAMLSYEVTSARVLNTDFVNEEDLDLIDALSHNLPFHINMSLDKRYIEKRGGVSNFSVSITWPLDSLNDERDSKWGNEAYKFQQEEISKHNEDSSYVPRKSIKIIISVKAEQLINEEDSPDINYNVGDLILYDIEKNQRCETLSDTCIKTYVMDTNNKIKDQTVTLLPHLYGSYSSNTYLNYDTSLNETINTWNVETKPLMLEDILKVIAIDNQNSYLKRDSLSDVIIGNLNNENQIATIIEKSKNYNGFFTYSSEKFPFLSSNKCYWVKTEYNVDKAYAFQKQDETTTKIYGNEKSATCYVVPLIIAPKNNLIKSNS